MQAEFVWAELLGKGAVVFERAFQLNEVAFVIDALFKLADKLGRDTD